MDKKIPTIDEIAEIVEQAGKFAHSKWREGDTPDAKVWDKSQNHPVCDIDIAVDRFLKMKLQQICPSAGWLSEETADDAERLGHRFNWSVDPIDGTKDYIAGKSGWCVSVAFLDGDKVIMAVLSAPAEGMLWTASRGGGAFCNGRKLWASKRQIFKGARLSADKFNDNINKLTLVYKPNSIALRIAMIAADQADILGSVRFGNEWDVAAAYLIAEEAGAYIGDVYGHAIKFNKSNPVDFGVICCSAALKDDVIAYIKPAVDRVFNR